MGLNCETDSTLFKLTNQNVLCRRCVRLRPHMGLRLLLSRLLHCKTKLSTNVKDTIKIAAADKFNTFTTFKKLNSF